MEPLGKEKKICCLIINDREVATFVNHTLTYLHVFCPFIYSTHNIYVHIAHGMSSNSTSPPIQLVPKFRTTCWQSVLGSSGRHLYILLVKTKPKPYQSRLKKGSDSLTSHIITSRASCGAKKYEKVYFYIFRPSTMMSTLLWVKKNIIQESYKLQTNM